jgi:hypothetical protein
MDRLQGFRQGTQTVWILGLLLLLPGMYLFFNQSYRLLIGLMIMGAILVAWHTSRRVALVMLFGFLLMLGDIRRIIDTFAGSQSLDLLLLVGPIVTVYISVPLLMRLKLTDRTSKAIFGLLALMALEVFNPRQGPIAVGIAGALFWIIPVLWFWIGRWLGSEKLIFILLYRVVFPLGVMDALLGLFQSAFGFLSWEDAWARPQIGQYNLGAGQVRPFGFSSSGAEYSITLCFATVLVFSALFAGRKIYALALPILLLALVLASSRGAIVKILFAVAVIWAVRGKPGRNWVFRFVATLCVGLALLIYSASTVAANQGELRNPQKATSAQLATSHVTEGLAHPLDSKHSTGGIHAAMFWFGIVRGFTNPVGNGLGSTTLAAGKFGGDVTASGSTEIDISDAFVTLGCVGGILFLYIIFATFSVALQYVRTGPKMLSYAFVGLLSAMLGAWVPPSYATGSLIWLSIGTIMVTQNQNKAIKPRLEKNRGMLLE